MREYLKMVIVLAAICGISGFSLAYLKETTEPIIEEQVLEFVQGPALKRVYPNAENDPIAERKIFKSGDKEITVFPFMENNQLMGIALESTGGGFGGDIGMMVGFNLDRDTLIAVGVTSMSETPGIGTLITEPKFANQFKEQTLDINLTSRGGNIDTISGATVSSVGAVDAVKNAAKEYQALKGDIIKAWQ